MSDYYSGAITREQFLFREMRITARLYQDGSQGADLVRGIVQGNLFQYPTEKMIKNIAEVCARRIGHLTDLPYFLDALASGAITEAKQAALLAMMLDSRLMAEFMVSVIGKKFSMGDLTLTRKEIRLFLLGIQDQDEAAAKWTEKTFEKIRQVFQKCLQETGFLDDIGTGVLYPALPSMEFAAALKEAGLHHFLPAFNILS